MNEKLTLEIIRSYGMKERTYKPDWDDTCIDFTTPSGLILTTMTQCNNEPTKFNRLEGLDGFVYIESKVELDELLSLSYDELLDKIELEEKNFDKSKFMDW
jgi:hypothetical protein